MGRPARRNAPPRCCRRRRCLAAATLLAARLFCCSAAAAHALCCLPCTAVAITVGPACQTVDKLVALLEAGVTCARIDLTVRRS